MAILTSKVVIGTLKFLGGAAVGGVVSGVTSELTRSHLEQSAGRINSNAQQFQQCCDRITIQINNITNIHWEGDNSGIMNNQWISDQRPAMDAMFASQMDIYNDILTTMANFDQAAQTTQASQGNIRNAR